jgi:hypothetical protein
MFADKTNILVLRDSATGRRVWIAQVGKEKA